MTTAFPCLSRKSNETWVSQLDVVGLTLPGRRLSHTSQRRSMLQWWSQKIGSSAAVAKLPIHPSSPATAPCIVPCGVFSVEPKDPPPWLKIVTGPPNPALPPESPPGNFVRRRQYP